MEKASTYRDRVQAVSLYPDVTDSDQVLRRVAELIRKGDGGYVCFSTVHMIMESYDSPEFAAKVNAADMVAPDGMPIVWLQKLQGRKHASRVRGNDLMILLCEYAEQHNFRVAFYGGKQEVLDALLDKARNRFPNLEIVYASSPPFRQLTQEEDQRITAEINDADPDILFVGLGCPKQENWMAAHKEHLRAVMLGIGASFDFFAGNIKESPAWIGRLGLEWLFRLTQEPRRLWRRYLILNPRFMWHAMLQLMSRRSRSLPAGPRDNG